VKYRIPKARGFAFSEILIVLVILSILGGTLMITLGPSEEKAKATRVQADLDALRSAVLTYSHENSWNKAAFAAVTTEGESMLSATSISPYLTQELRQTISVIRVNGRLLSGFVNHSDITESVSKRLRKAAEPEGLLDNKGDVYTNGADIYVYVR